MPYNPFERMTSSTASDPSPDAGVAAALLRKALDCKAKGVAFHHKASLLTHMWGLQGVKRWHRYQLHEDFCEMVDLQHYLIDQYGDMYSPEVKESYLDTVTDLEGLLKAYYDYEFRYSGIMTDITNQLTLANLGNDAHKIRGILCGVSKELEKCRRWLQDFSKAGWAWDYIRIVDDRLHEKMKSEESYLK